MVRFICILVYELIIFCTFINTLATSSSRHLSLEYYIFSRRAIRRYFIFIANISFVVFLRWLLSNDLSEPVSKNEFNKTFSSALCKTKLIASSEALESVSK